MNLNDFYYELDKSFIAQTPLKHRDESKLLILEKSTGKIYHDKFCSIVNFLNEGDCLIFNDSRVLKARLFGVNEKTGARLEFVFLNEIEHDVWQVLCKPARRARIESRFNFDGEFNAIVLSEHDEGLRTVKVEGFSGNFFDVLDKIGSVPLPPYIKKKLIDQNRYQTIYSKKLGSVASPTAGLHFTNSIFEKIKQKGVSVGFLTLHVGLGTFRPVKVLNIYDHKMHSERYFFSHEVADLINRTKQNGCRVFCVGTTSCRTIESVFLKHKKICADSGSTNLFIYPGFKFRVVDGLVTNFHLPCSTLLMLVSAFAGKSNVFNAYEQAKKKGYRFFSFGDVMLIV